MSKVLHSESDTGLRATPGEVAPAPVEGGATGEGIAITPLAAREIIKQLAKRGTPEAAIRVGLKGGGCSGFSYLFDFADGGPREGDQVFSEHGATIYVDPKSYRLLKGMTLDYSQSLMQRGFKFLNPNAKGTCGCGESVQF